jgi:hypothetical protein
MTLSPRSLFGAPRLTHTPKFAQLRKMLCVLVPQRAAVLAALKTCRKREEFVDEQLGIEHYMRFRIREEERREEDKRILRFLHELVKEFPDEYDHLRGVVFAASVCDALKRRDRNGWERWVWERVALCYGTEGIEYTHRGRVHREFDVVYYCFKAADPSEEEYAECYECKIAARSVKLGQLGLHFLAQDRCRFPSEVCVATADDPGITRVKLVQELRGSPFSGRPVYTVGPDDLDLLGSEHLSEECWGHGRLELPV